MGAVGTVRSEGKPQEGLYKDSLGLRAGLDRFGYSHPICMGNLPLLCSEHKGLRNDSPCPAAPTDPLEMISLRKRSFLLQKMKWSSKVFALHWKALVHVQNVSVFVCLYLP